MRFTSTGTVYGVNYVVAKDAEEAYQKVKKFLDNKDIGFTKDRVLESIELLAEETNYTGTGYMLYL